MRREFPVSAFHLIFMLRAVPARVPPLSGDNPVAKRAMCGKESEEQVEEDAMNWNSSQRNPNDHNSGTRQRLLAILAAQGVLTEALLARAHDNPDEDVLEIDITEFEGCFGGDTDDEDDELDDLEEDELDDEEEEEEEE